MARSLTAGVEELAKMTAFELLKKQMESGSTEAAIDSMKRVAVVAVAMGADAASKELVPYLEATCFQQPPHADELLLILGQQLPQVADFLGPTHCQAFLPMLERLCAIEETVVREQACIVVNHLVPIVVADKGHAKYIDSAQWVAVARRLAAADWFTAKVSACHVTAPVFTLTSDEELLTTFKELTVDETPMVRRAAAKHLGKVLKAAGWQHKDLVVAALPVLIRDEQDSVRLLAVAALAEVGSSYAEHAAWTVQNWLPLVKDGSTDMSWCVYFVVMFIAVAVIVYCLWPIAQSLTHTHDAFLLLLTLFATGAFVTISPRTFRTLPTIWAFKETPVSTANSPWSWLALSRS